MTICFLLGFSYEQDVYCWVSISVIVHAAGIYLYLLFSLEYGFSYTIFLLSL